MDERRGAIDCVHGFVRLCPYCGERRAMALRALAKRLRGSPEPEDLVEAAIELETLASQQTRVT